VKPTFWSNFFIFGFDAILASIEPSLFTLAEASETKQTQWSVPCVCHEYSNNFITSKPFSNCWRSSLLIFFVNEGSLGSNSNRLLNFFIPTLGVCSQTHMIRLIADFRMSPKSIPHLVVWDTCYRFVFRILTTCEVLGIRPFFIGRFNLFNCLCIKIDTCKLDI
jgi:hypothetical protein